MITISEDSADRLVIRDTRFHEVGRDAGLAVGWMTACWLATAALAAAAGHLQSARGFLLFLLIGVAVTAALADGMLARCGRSFVEIDLRARRVVRHRRGILRWRREAPLSDFWAIDARARPFEDRIDWQLRLLARLSDFRPLVLGDCLETEDLEPVLRRVAAATGLTLTSEAESYRSRRAPAAGSNAIVES